MYVLQEIVEEYLKQGKSIYLAFLDIEKAFDRIIRDMLWSQLENLGMDEYLINIIKCYYHKNEVKLNLGGIETEWIKNNVGVRQGCTMSPTLYNFFKVELLEKVKNVDAGLHLNGRKLNCLEFADDIVIMSETSEGLQELLNQVQSYGNERKVKLSGSKCKMLIMVFENESISGAFLGA